MAKPKNLILPMSVDIAKASHNCQHSDRHRIQSGDKRLKVRSGRSPEHYCTSCALQFIESAVQRLEDLRAQLVGKQPE